MKQFYDQIAYAVEVVLQEEFKKKMGFALLVFEFESEKKGGHYVSNGKREDMIILLRDIADQIETNEIIGTPIGEA